MAAVHAGWRGLSKGVLGAAVDAMGGLGASRVEAAIGPCIHAECYEFSSEDLEPLETVLGSSIRSRSRTGELALDMVEAVSVALDLAGARVVSVDPVCTACSPTHFSYRAARDSARQAAVVWRD